MTDTLTERIDALLATVALNPGMVATAQQTRDRGILEVLRELTERLLAAQDEIEQLNKRLAALEARKDAQTGDGR